MKEHAITKLKQLLEAKLNLTDAELGVIKLLQRWAKLLTQQDYDAYRQDVMGVLRRNGYYVDTVTALTGRSKLASFVVEFDSEKMAISFYRIAVGLEIKLRWGTGESYYYHVDLRGA